MATPVVGTISTQFSISTLLPESRKFQCALKGQYVSRGHSRVDNTRKAFVQQRASPISSIM